jgi:hypothetical protein
VVTRLLLILLCLAVLSTATGCSTTAYGTSSYGVGAYQGEPSGGGTDAEMQRDRKHWGDQDGMYHPWNRPSGYSDLN